jgi:hypothetical protein
MTKVAFVDCGACGYEDFDVEIVYVRTVANGDVYECPMCKQETMDVQKEVSFDE